LRRKFKGGFITMVNFMMEFKIIKNFEAGGERYLLFENK